MHAQYLVDRADPRSCGPRPAAAGPHCAPDTARPSPARGVGDLTPPRHRGVKTPGTAGKWNGSIHKHPCSGVEGAHWQSAIWEMENNSASQIDGMWKCITIQPTMVAESPNHHRVQNAKIPVKRKIPGKR